MLSADARAFGRVKAFAQAAAVEYGAHRGHRTGARRAGFTHPHPADPAAAAAAAEQPSALGIALEHCKASLVELDARGSLDARGVAQVIGLLGKPECALRRLVLPGCAALRDESGIDAFASALATNRSVEQLQLGCSYINAAGAASIASALSVNEKLQQLELPYNPLLDVGCQALGRALVRNSCLRTLVLPFTGLGDGACAALALALRGGCPLITLDLSGNQLTAAGVAALAPALAHTQLASLALSANQRIGGRGVAALAAVLPEASSLRSLSLDGCAVGAAPCGRLAASLVRSHVASLDLSGNEIGDEGSWELAWRLPECANLRTLSLANNDIEEDGASELLSGLAATTAGITATAAKNVTTALSQLDLRGNRISAASPTHAALAAMGFVNLAFQRAPPWAPAVA